MRCVGRFPARTSPERETSHPNATAGARPVCNSDTIRDGSEPKLPYGSRTAALDPVACVSEESGVTCVDSGSQHGFFIARSTFVTF